MADPNKIKQVADLSEQWKKFNLVFERTTALAKEYSAAIAKGAPPSGGGGSTSFQNPGSNAGGVGGFHQPPSPNQYGFRQMAGDLAATGVTALTQMINPSMYIENEMARRRFAAFGGSTTSTGAGYRNGAFQQMMRGGTFMDPMDAARAGMAGISMGFAPGLSNYGTVAKSVATMSNLMPGVTGEQAMGAVAAVNQASSVNRLRMIGIQVRNANGDFMGITSIVNQLWNLLQRQATPGKPISKSDIAFSLQPGNALASILDQYFGNDPILRSGVITALLAKASGSDLSKGSLEQLGILTGVAASTGKKNAAVYSATNRYTASGVQGVMDANSAIATAAQGFEAAAGTFSEGVNRLVSGLDVFAGAGNGAGGTLMAGVASTMKQAFSGLALGAELKLGAKLTEKMVPLLGRLGALVGITEAATVAASTAVLAIPAAFAVLGIDLMQHNATLNAKLIKSKSARRKYSSGVESQTSDVAAHSSGGFYSSTDYLSGGSSRTSYSGGNMDMGGSGGEGVGGIGGSASISSPLDGVLSTPTNGEFGNFASFRSRKHRGQDFKAKTGTPIKAVRAGKVIKVGVEGDLGNMVRIRHADGMRTVYAHLSSQGVTEGMEVGAGQQIGLAGYSGGVYPKGPGGAHLHLALEDSNGGVHNPMPYISGASSVYSNLGNNMSDAGSAAAISSPVSHGRAMYNMGGANMYSTAVGDIGGVPTSSSAVNYGGVTVHINVPSGMSMNETTLANEIKRVLRDEEQMKMAVTR